MTFVRSESGLLSVVGLINNECVDDQTNSEMWKGLLEFDEIWKDK